MLTQLCNKYHHVDTFRAHGDKCTQTQSTLYSVNALCCYKENCNTMKEIQSDDDAVGAWSDKLLLDGTWPDTKLLQSTSIIAHNLFMLYIYVYNINNNMHVCAASVRLDAEVNSNSLQHLALSLTSTSKQALRTMTSKSLRQWWRSTSPTTYGPSVTNIYITACLPHVPYDSCIPLYVAKHVCDYLWVGLYRIYARVMTSCPMYYASFSKSPFTVESLQ